MNETSETAPYVAPVVYADHVVVNGETFPRCVRAVGIARCYGWVTDPDSNECDTHLAGWQS